ncbi:pentatricopeptide repeat-containing protein At2g39620 isoform X1 [Dendrobium catenatum]|uniref:Pentatricopeptide repeat-containing protein n=1 Tax=Dendrobium catenatum TaxID=906689 RepID=A0A2I0VUU1_9ASPA|nr:pentatricopeptide repeat-containing protein At2g39620 isoform X1 [Dendrobium catenatum]PKU67170.1 Pentatricopeptide repeat-containing protein [Dendrobium catenatum]
MVVRIRRGRSCSSVAAAAIDFTKPALIFPSESSNFIQLIHSCKKIESFLQIHAQLFTRGIESNDSFRTLLVNSYSFFSRPDFSLSIFNSTPNPSIVLWNSMIRAYTKSGEHKEAIRLYHIMLQRGIEPDKYTFTFVLKACSGSLDSRTGILIHEEIARRKLQGDAYIGTTLLDMYGRLGMVGAASQVFDSMPDCDVVSLNAMISGFNQNKQSHQALALFRKMLSTSITPNKITILNLFPAVCELSNALLCRSLHGFIARRLFLPAVANGLIDAYSKCGLVEAARRIFNGMSESRDDVTWGTMISGFFYNDFFTDALDLFDELRRENMKLNQVSVLSALSAAAETGNLEKGIEIHMHAVDKGMDFDISVNTVLVTMYAKCGEVEKAKQLFFDGMPEKDIIAWSAMISAFAQSGQPKEAVSIFKKMNLEGITPTSITIVSILPACADMLDLNAGKSIHCISLKSGINFDGSVGTAFVAMYAQCGSFISSLKLFDRLQNKDIVTWNALINGYAQIGDARNAVKLFHELHLSGLQPDRATLVGLLSVFTFLDKFHEGTSVHGLTIKRGLGSDLHVKNATMDMYAKCGDLKAAETVFLETKSHVDVIAWNTMIAGYAHNGFANEAISVFYQMRSDNIRPNLVTLVSIIPTAGYLSSLRDGLALHSISIQTGFESHVVVGNSLIDMYSKCGRLDVARDLFDQMEYRDIVSWNVMLGGYAMHGIGESVINLFSQMKGSSVRPDSVSLVSVLSACRHVGLVDVGRKIFKSMRSELDLEPNKKHYACMVDLLGRAGQFDEAWELLKAMGEETDSSIWGALLGAAKMHCHVKMGELAVEHLLKLEPQNPSHYVILANIYADSGRWADAERIRAAMRNMGVSTSPGCSWLQISEKNILYTD